MEHSLPVKAHYRFVMEHCRYAIIDRKGIVRALGVQPQYVETIVQKLLLAEPTP